MVIDENGDVGIGTNSPSYDLHVYRASGEVSVRSNSASLADGQACDVGATSGSRGAAVGVYKHDGITNNCGFLYLCTQDGTNTYLWVDDSDPLGLLRISTTSTHIGSSTSGTVVGDQTSDVRLKSEIKPSDYGLAEVKRMSPIKFKMHGKADVGFSAQDMREIIPEAVYDSKENVDSTANTKLVMSYPKLIPILVKAIQEQQTQIDNLTKRIEALEKK
jgi:hypothetical protein